MVAQQFTGGMVEWIVAAAGIMVIANLALSTLNAWRTFRTKADQPVTKAELDAQSMLLKADISALKSEMKADAAVIKADLVAAEARLTKRADETEQYHRSRIHELGVAVQKIALDVARLLAMYEKDHERK